MYMPIVSLTRRELLLPPVLFLSPAHRAASAFRSPYAQVGKRKSKSLYICGPGNFDIFFSSFKRYTVDHLEFSIVDTTRHPFRAIMCPPASLYALVFSGNRFSLRFTPNSSRIDCSSFTYSSYWLLFSTLALIPIQRRKKSVLVMEFRQLCRPTKHRGYCA
jgi:hypothetical protein